MGLQGNDNNSYPLCDQPYAAGLHIRAYSGDAERTRTCDLAAVANAWIDGGYPVTIICADLNPSDMVSAVGRGWQDPMLEIVRATDLLGVTAVLYRAWAHSSISGKDLPDVIIIDDVQRLATGIDGGHDDELMLSWLQRVLGNSPAEACNQLEDLVGLSYGHYVKQARGPKHPLPSTSAKPVFVIGGRRRRGGSGIRSIMGGSALLHLSSTIVEISDVSMGAGNMVSATAIVHKARYGIHQDRQPIQRGTDTGYWQAA